MNFRKSALVMLPLAALLLVSPVAIAGEMKPAGAPPAEAPPAEAVPPREISSKLLVGKWKGQMQMKVDEQCKKVDIALEFLVDGKLVITSKDQVQESTYRIEKDTVWLADPDQKGFDVILKHVRLDQTTLEADMVPVKTDALAPAAVMTLSLTRQ